MKVLITGASGFVGKALAGRLIAQGSEVIGISRAPEKQEKIQGLTWTTLKKAPECEVVIHLAGESILGIWTESKKKKIYDSRVLGAKHLLNALESWTVKPKTFISASAVGIYGDRGDEALTENSDLDLQNGFLSKVCRAWEKESFQAEHIGARVVRARFGLVMDPYDGMLGLQWPSFRAKVCLVPNRPEGYMPWISLHDLVSALIYLVEHKSIQGEVNLTAPVPVKMSEWVSVLDEHFNFGIKAFIPEFLLKPLGHDFVREAYSSQKAIPQRLLESGFQFHDSTWREYVASLFNTK
ncbi:MAG: TIGR01777 family oxidoreductase [Verrucomicrobiota bacterium]